MHKICFISIACFITSLIPLASSAGNPASGGDPTFDFLRIPMSARAASLGDTYLTMYNDASAVFSNPSALSTIDKPMGSLGFIKHLLDVNAGYLAYSRKYEGIGYFGANMIYINYGTFDAADKSGNVTGTFGAGELAIGLSYANAVNQFHYGSTVKFIYSHIEKYNATGLALDAGASYYFPKEEIVIGLRALNMGAQLQAYADTKESLPFDVSIGIEKKLEHLPLRLMLNLHKLQDPVKDILTRFSFGGEFTLSSVLKARIGYNNQIRQELKIGNSSGLAGFSGGFGLTIRSLLFDYGFSSFGKIGDLHRIGLTTTL
jgi:hypothetical protein